MSAGEIVGIAVGCFAILTALGHIIRLLYRLVRTWEGMREDVGELKAVLNNGLRSEVKSAAANSAKAVELAGEAAAKVDAFEQRQEDTQRAVNALRAEVDVYTNVVLQDRRHIRRTLAEAGIELRDDDIDAP